MSKRTHNIKRIPTTQGDGNVIDVYVSYQKGGVSFATYKNEPRGYYLHVQPIKIKNEGNFTVTSFTGFSGYKQHIKAANRFSQKQLEAAASECENNDIMQYMIDCVCQKNGIELAETPATAA